MGRRGGKKKQKKAIEQKDRQEVRNEQKKKNKNSANQEEDPQEVRNEQKKNNSIPENDPQEDVNDEATAKNKFQKGTHKFIWHQKLQKLPPGQVIDIPYLKTLEKNTSVPIAYCPEVVTDPHARSIVDSAQASNFVPGYLASADGRHWEVFDVQKFSVNKFNWDEGEKSILNLFGTSIQHPEDHLVQYFCDTEHTPIERRSPRLSPRKNLPESDNSVGRQLFSVVSPGRGDADLPGKVGAQGDNERGKEGQGGEVDNVAGGDADLPGQVGALGGQRSRQRGSGRGE
jgi:hypothetical protein